LNHPCDGGNLSSTQVGSTEAVEVGCAAIHRLLQFIGVLDLCYSSLSGDGTRVLGSELTKSGLGFFDFSSSYEEVGGFGSEVDTRENRKRPDLIQKQ